MSAVRIQIREVGSGKLLASQLIDDGEAKIYVGDRTLKTELKKSPPTAVCWNDGEPLIGTFEFPQYEFVCQVCGKLYGFLSPDKAKSTAELDARHDELRAEYEIARAERKAAAATPKRVDAVIGA